MKKIEKRKIVVFIVLLMLCIVSVASVKNFVTKVIGTENTASVRSALQFTPMVVKVGKTESQIVELVILMARKVIKILSDNQKNVIMANTLSALKKVRARGEVTLRVNLEDVKLTTAHIEEFIQHVENIKGITVLEDSTVEKGGCVVETDFGSIDARISSQLTELENKILEISPLKTIKRAAPTVEE